MTDPSPPPGTGPGVITPDGCAVDFYARITARGEPEIVHDAAGPGASVLELGCGAGRITHPLLAPGWFAAAADAENARDGIIFRMRDVSRPAPNLVSATVEYMDGDQVWTQTFTARRLDDTELAAVLAERRPAPGPLSHRRPQLAVRRPRGLTSALAAEGTAAGGRAVGTMHLAGVVHSLGAGVRAALTLKGLAELALHLVEVGLRGFRGRAGLLLAGLGGLGVGLGGRRLGSRLLDGHADLLRHRSTYTASHTRAGFIEPPPG